MPKLGKNKDDQKRSNFGLILKLLATKQCSSRIELSKATGLTKTAISQIVAEMMEQGYVEEEGKEIRMESGRNPLKLAISPNGPKFIGILIERTRCAAILCDLNLKLLKIENIEKEATTEEELLEIVFELMDHMMATNIPVMAIGVASIGPLNIAEGIIKNPYFFHDIHDVEIRRILEERYHLPVYFDHDNQSAALAEFLYGNGRGYQDLLLVGVGRGVGCGIMAQGHRIHSTYGYAPEFGHTTIAYNGKKCICGNRGCLERYVNIDIMAERFASIMGEKLPYEVYMEHLARPQMEEVMREALEILTAGLISIMNVLNPQIILLGMSCNYWPDRYIQEMQDEVNRIKFGNKNVLIPVKKTHFGTDSQLMGAACNAMNWIFNGYEPRIATEGI